MATFSYIATDSQGKSINSKVDAEDKSKAIQAIRRQGFTPISVKDAKVSNISSLGSISFLTSKKVKNDDLVMFTRQLSAMVSAGVPIIRALTSQKDHTDSKALETILTATIADVEGGSSLADSLEKHPNTFSDVYVNMVRS
ncbi:MAG: type II secretion system F family protein, partial [Candidatus Saccharimonas sp.]